MGSKSSAVAFALLIVLAAHAAHTTALDPIVAAVQARRLVVDDGTRAGDRDVAALDRAERALVRRSRSVGGDLGLVRKAAKRLDRRFEDDAEFGPLLDTALDTLAHSALTQRNGLARWAGDVGPPWAERRLRAATGHFDRFLVRSRTAPHVRSRANRLRKGCRKLDRVQALLGVAPRLDTPPSGGSVPDFMLPDVNPATASVRDVSPRDHVGDVSAWYFGHAT